MNTDPSTDDIQLGPHSQPGLGKPGSRPLLHLVVLGSVFVPLACISYIPIRRHLLGLRRSVDTLSNNTAILQRDLSNTLLSAHLRKEESLRLADQLHELRMQLDAATTRAAESERARLISERDMAGRLRAASDRVAEAESARTKTEESLRRQVDSLRRRAERQSISPDVLQDVCTSLGDTATFLEEVEIQLGWSHSMPRDRGIDRMRQLALKLHTVAQAKQPQPNDTQ